MISCLFICGGKNFYVGKGEEKGRTVSNLARYRGAFDWDQILLADEGNSDGLTNVEMTKEMKNSRSMRKKVKGGSNSHVS